MLGFKVAFPGANATLRLRFCKLFHFPLVPAVHQLQNGGLTANSPDDRQCVRRDPAKFMELLVVEDDQVLGKAIQRGLTEAGHRCEWVRNGQRGLAEAQTQRFDAIVLDLLLPDLSGMEVMKSIRSEGIRTPVLMLTALSSIEDRVGGLKAGADDYLVKPFAFPELIARLEAIIRRTGDRPSSTRRPRGGRSWRRSARCRAR